MRTRREGGVAANGMCLMRGADVRVIEWQIRRHYYLPLPSPWSLGPKGWDALAQRGINWLF